MGNKIDLEELRRIPSDMGEQMAQSMGMHYMECSAVNIWNYSYFINIIEIHFKLQALMFILDCVKITDIKDNHNCIYRD